MPVSLVLGANGQDGGYLAKTLLERGHDVIGVGRDETSRFVSPSPGFRYVQLDLRDARSLTDLLHAASPDFAFHFAAVHGTAEFEYETVWPDMLAVNVVALHALLEHARSSAAAMRIIYAGSSKVFPSPLSGTINEDTEMRATCLYGIGKIASRSAMAYYRDRHGVSATNLILFNHDSVRRPAHFFLPTIARGIAAALEDPSHQIRIRTLDFRIDWSAADELMEFAADLAERTDVPEVILASGTTWHGRAAIRDLFAGYGLDAERHVVETLPRSDPGPEFSVSLDRLDHLLGRRPRKTLAEIVDEMVAAFRSDAGNRTH